MAGNAARRRPVDLFACQQLLRVTPQAIAVRRLVVAPVGLVALIAVEPGHRHSLREPPRLRFSMTVKTLLPVRDKGFPLPRRKGMTPEARDILHTHPVHLETLVTIQAIGIVGTKGVAMTAVTVLAGDFFPRDMTGVAR